MNIQENGYHNSSGNNDSEANKIDSKSEDNQIVSEEEKMFHL